MADSSVEPKTPKSTVHLVPPIIAKALIQIQRELTPLMKSAENGAFTGATYVPLDEVTEAAHTLLSAYKIAILQPMTTDDNGHAALETILVHESGQSFSRITKLAMNNVSPQAHGSAVTYTRRYSLMTMIGLTARDDDDDGNKATGVFAPVTESQIAQIKTMLKHLKWPEKQIAAEVFNLKSRDAAALAISNFEGIVAQTVRDNESKKNATRIEVGGVDQEGEDVGLDPLSEMGFKQRLRSLKLTSPSFENKVINIAAGVPFLKKVMMKPERIQGLDTMLKALESGVQTLPSEFYAPTAEPRVVNEDVA